jgi:hypothetical protein
MWHGWGQLCLGQGQICGMARADYYGRASCVASAEAEFWDEIQTKA